MDRFAPISLLLLMSCDLTNAAGGYEMQSKKSSYSFFLTTFIFAATTLLTQPALAQDSEILEALLARLEWREQELDNVHFSLTGSMSRKSSPSAESELLETSEFSRWSMPGHLAFETANYMSDGTLYKRTRSAWDGEVKRTYFNRPETKNQHKGAISDRSPITVLNVIYNMSLGLNMRNTVRPMTLSQMIRECAALENTETVVRQNTDGKWVVRLSKTGSTGYFEEYILDPDRDYMPIELRHQNSNFEIHRIIEASNESGLWIPTKVEVETGTVLSEGRGIFEYQINEFKRDVVTPDDFSVEFPDGTWVVDYIANLSYRISGLDREMLPFRDPESGAVYANGVASPIANADLIDMPPIVSTEFASESHVRIGHAPPATAQEDRVRMPMILVGVLMIIVSGVGWYFLEKRRGATDKP